MATNTAKSKRGPMVLVTDAREVPFSRGMGRPQPARTSTKIISVDSILQYASDIPSAQRRDHVRPAHLRTPSGRHPLSPKLSGRVIPKNLPARTTKVSEKLVLLPETEVDEEKREFGGDEDEEEGPPRDDELERRRKYAGPKEKSYAERLPKAKRTEKVARVTAYCTAQAYKLLATAEFVRNQHGARTKLYDDCLYTVYHLPLVGGNDRYRVRSGPVLKAPGGKSVLDEEIERNERRDYREGYFGETEQYGVLDNEDGSSPLRAQDSSPSAFHPLDRRDSGDNSARPSSPQRIAPNALSFAEMFVYSYGVVVLWNFSETQEKDILADLTFSSAETGVQLATKPQQEEDFETEEFHFDYNPDIPRPRVYNDMITLRSGDHMIKLAMSHAIAQSTKLSFFEERMASMMDEAQHIPRRLALTGRLGLNRQEVVRILGRLFQSRVDVNLSSNMLDVPNFFWESEPTLHPLYAAVREYLEINPRIKVLNERCRVFLDLAEILSDSIADKKMTKITWIIIVLIVLSIVVTCSEVFLRFGIVSGEKRKTNPGAGLNLTQLCADHAAGYGLVGGGTSSSGPVGLGEL